MEIPSQSSLYTHIALPAETDKREPVNKDNGAVVAQTQTAELGHARGVKTSRPAWLKKAMFRDDTVVQTEHGPGHIQNSRSSQRWEDDQFDANRPSDEFLLSIHRHLAHRWANDRAAAFDQVSNGSYAASRRAELRAIPGAGYLAEQYGLQTARDNISRTRPGLRIDNRLSASYQRTSPNDGLRTQCLSIYRSLGHTHPPEMVVFVNSEINASRTLAMLDDWKPASGLVGKATCNVQPLKRGLVALEFHSPPQFAEQAGKILAKLGGRPSSYEVGKIAYAARTPFKPSSRLGKEIDNHKMLFGTLSEDSKRSISALKKLSAGHAMRTTANCAASLLDGLRKELFEKVDTPQFKHDVLIANALNALINTVRALPTMTEDSTRFFAGYDAMLESPSCLEPVLHLFKSCIQLAMSCLKVVVETIVDPHSHVPSAVACHDVLP